MLEIRTEIDIEASPPRVWRALTDFKTFPDWNPFVLAVEGEPRFSGLLVPWLQRGLESSTRSGFMAMNRAVKRRLERRPLYA
jgi:hypothetical protein